MKAIVTTTINKPSEAIKKLIEKFTGDPTGDEWKIYVVMDKKTPTKEWEDLHNRQLVTCLNVEYQEKRFKKLSDLIGWNCIQRRSLGFIEAYEEGAQIVATIDDDNIPYPFWGHNYINKEILVDMYQPEVPVFDPLSVTEHNMLWHRGFPIELVNNRAAKYMGKKKRKVLIQADLWDGDPDIDAMARMIYHPIVKFNHVDPFAGTAISPFNSQNTFLAREVIPYYFMYPGIGRMDDIWAAYTVQKQFPDSVIYDRASVYQARNVHNLSTDLKNEMYGIEHTFEFLTNKDVLPSRAKEAYAEYQKYFRP
jgi:hypothetical protein